MIQDRISFRERKVRKGNQGSEDDLAADLDFVQITFNVSYEQASTSVIEQTLTQDKNMEALLVHHIHNENNK